MNHYLQTLEPKTKKLLDKLQKLELQLQDLFLPQLVFIDHREILPGALLPKGTETLVFKGRNITPLLPLNPILLDYFTPKELIKQLKFELIDGNDLSQIRLSLDLPLIESPLFKDYTLKQENIISEVPVLEIWPNFQAEGWKEYYGFYYDAELGEETFQVGFPNVEEIHKFKERKANFQIVRCNEFPNFIKCKNSQNNRIGIILLPTPQKINLLYSWKIGIDFKPDYTSVYVNKDNKVIESFRLEKLHHKVTDVSIDTRFPTMFESFIPESFIPIDKPFPMYTALTTRGSADINQERPIFDGRFYIPNLERFAPQETWIKTNLKWPTKNLRYIRLFLKHLTLHLTAHAVKNQIKEIQWCISYPPNFSRRDKCEYAQMWQNITDDLQNKTGVKHLSPDINDNQHFRSENLAFAQYFAEFEQHDLVNTTCIDIGNTVSNISIWQNNQLIHQCSLNFGKRDLFSQFIKTNPQILTKFYLKQSLPEAAFHAILDAWLLFDSANWLETKRDRFAEDKDFQGLIRLMAIGVSGLYFYIGQILSALHKEGKYTFNEITPVYIGGTGSRLLYWFAEGGKFNRNSEINSLLSSMMSIASGFPDTEELTRISKNPQEEVACGLVLNKTILQNINTNEPNHLISGEYCEINGKRFTNTSRLTISSISNQIQVSKISELRKFFNAFHENLEYLNIDGIHPLPGYDLNLETEYEQTLWQMTKTELQNSLLSLNSNSIEPIFILELKVLLKILAKDWHNK